MSTNSFSGTPWEATAMRSVPWKVAALSRSTKRAATNARRSFCCPGPAGIGWALNQRRMVAADSSPSAT